MLISNTDTYPYTSPAIRNWSEASVHRSRTFLSSPALDNEKLPTVGGERIGSISIMCRTNFFDKKGYCTCAFTHGLLFACIAHKKMLVFSILHIIIHVVYVLKVMITQKLIAQFT